jgi:hypothetical protein
MSKPPVGDKVVQLKSPVPQATLTNGDEVLDFGGARYIGNFHKTLPRHPNQTGEVEHRAYVAFATICDKDGDIEDVPASKDATKLVNPAAGRATEAFGPNPGTIHMIPAPSVLSESTAAEALELFWMVKLRDQAFNTLNQASLQDAVQDLSKAFQQALDADCRTTGDLRLGLDLPAVAGAAGKPSLNITAQTVFRAGLPDEQYGPLVSQFFLQDINYGAQLIKQTLVPYKAGKDFLKAPAEWLSAQATGKDKFGNAYPTCNNFTSGKANGEVYFENTRRRISTMRDLARFVNRDALHQAYFNAALLLDSWGAPTDPGNPYNHLTRQAGFGTLGGPNLLALVSEVSSRALKCVWRQKWLHRRLRPEAYGGLMSVQQFGMAGEVTRAYGLPKLAFGTLTDGTTLKVADDIAKYKGLLPIAFSAGSPAHPAYGAGHATVAGACVTILKAWYDESLSIQSLLDGANAKPRDPSPYDTDLSVNDSFKLEIWQPGTELSDGQLPVYKEEDAACMTIGGELNKLAANVALGRSMGGVHWRSDNTRSLRLGEQVATIMLARLLPSYAEKPQLSYTNFDGNKVVITAKGKVMVANDPELEAFYTRDF